MKNLMLYIFLICIWNSILFYGYQLGTNVILFMIPLSIYLVYMLKTNNKIVSKKGLLFLIPINLLSCSYFIYNNLFFKYCNMAMITLLFTFMYIFTMKPVYKIKEVFTDVVSLIIEPIDIIEKFYEKVVEEVKELLKINDNKMNKIKAFIIIIPVVITVLLLLGSADMMFGSIFNGFFKLFKNIEVKDIILRIALMGLLFTYLGSVSYFLLFKYRKLKNQETEEFKINNITITSLLTVLNIIYIIFDIIQIKSLIFHQVSSGIKYAEYARTGFFQLLFISIINLAIVLISKRSEEDTKYNKISSIIMVILTLIIIISSFLRMNMYEMAYGYTLLRLLVYVSLITEIILLIPTIIYIIKPNTNIFKYYMIIIISVYTIVSLCPIDYIIAKRNIDRYYDNNKIDLKYLKNDSPDNIELLLDLYHKTDDKDIKKELKDYFKYNSIDYKIKGLQDYNIYKEKAGKLLKEVN